MLGRSALPGITSASGALAHLRIALDPEQVASAQIIQSVFRQAGHSEELVAAAIVNAYAESRLRPHAVGDGGGAVGLFQLHERGAGHGMTTALRMDPVANTQQILRVVHGAFGRELRVLEKAGVPMRTLAAVFCRDIERPSNVEAQMAKRDALAETLFGPFAYSTGRAPPSADTAPGGKSPVPRIPGWGLSLTLAATVALVLVLGRILRPTPAPRGEAVGRGSVA